MTMFSIISSNAGRNDLNERKRLAKQKLRARLRRLRRRVRHAVSVEREKALIYRLLARRFGPDTPHRLLLRLLAQSEMRRMRRLERLLHDLPGTSAIRLRRRWLVAWKCWCVRHVPRKWAVLRLKHQKD